MKKNHKIKTISQELNKSLYIGQEVLSEARAAAGSTAVEQNEQAVHVMALLDDAEKSKQVRIGVARGYRSVKPDYNSFQVFLKSDLLADLNVSFDDLWIVTNGLHEHDTEFVYFGAFPQHHGTSLTSGVGRIKHLTNNTPYITSIDRLLHLICHQANKTRMEPVVF